MRKSLFHGGKWIIALVFSAMFLLLGCNIDSLSPMDSAVYSAISHLQGDFATGFFMGLTQLVHPITLIIVSIGMIFLMRKHYYWVPIFANLGISVMLNLSLKSMFTRVRPTDVIHLVTETGYSFPSGHTMAGTAFYGFLIYLIWQTALKKSYKQILTGVLACIILLVGTSRIYLGVHYFSDVLGGYLAASIYLIIFVSFVHAYFMQGKTLASSPVYKGKQGGFLIGFAYAIDGIIGGLKAERNLLIHFGAMTLVIIFGFILSISTSEWIACAIACAIVMAAELFNTAIETVVDMISPEYSEKAKLAKDTAAGAVLVAAIGAAVVGVIIFLPKAIALLGQM